MVEHFNLQENNHYYDGEWLYLNYRGGVYRFELIDYKGAAKSSRVYPMIYHDENIRQFYVFNDEKTRDWCYSLYRTEILGPKNVRKLLRTFTVKEFSKLWKEQNFITLNFETKIGELTSQAILNHPLWNDFGF